jgi:hypothetical protein
MLTAEPMRTPCLLRNLDQADCKRHGVNKAIQEGHSTAWLRGKRTFDNRPKAFHYPLVWVKSQYLHQRLRLPVATSGYSAPAIFRAEPGQMIGDNCLLRLQPWPFVICDLSCTRNISPGLVFLLPAPRLQQLTKN